MGKNRKPNQYKLENETFLDRKSWEEGVVELSSGVLARKLEQGSGTVSPGPSSLVYVRYTGRLIDGTVFDTTDGQDLPALFQVRQLIMGWQIALTRMHEGDIWEIYIPARWGYGSVRMDDIPAHSTLTFDLELVKIARL
ncbi:MAG: FKBP-type peptidyl-prolyl cis-trans isomerase [Bacteroidales bacterium]|nr:FKBP-type peptidyl-prolyl cis-trans isomerase [Bacteroidales bacterium]